MNAGFFPLDQASSVDWRYERLKLALDARCSVAHTIFGFYEKPCKFSAELVELLDSILVLAPTSRLSPRDVISAAWTEGRSLVIDLDAAGAPTEPRYRMLAEQPGSPSVVQAILAEDHSKPSRPIYRSGLGTSAASPPELVRQPPFREEGLAKLLREASERFQRSTHELFRGGGGPKGQDEGCVIC